MSEEVQAEQPKEKRKFLRRHKRGKEKAQVIDLDTALETLGEDIQVAAETETDSWSEPAWNDNEIAAQSEPEVSTNTGNWTFKLEIEDEKKED